MTSEKLSIFRRIIRWLRSLNKCETLGCDNQAVVCGVCRVCFCREKEEAYAETEQENQAKLKDAGKADTPKTDAASAWFLEPGLRSEHEIVFADFAREIERENNILREQRDALKYLVKKQKETKCAQ